MAFKLLDLFSGLGGFSLGLERTGYFQTVAFCDNDKYSKLIINKHWKGKKVYEDVREITKQRLKADGVQLPDIITGGFPCQPFSVAGKQKGTSDDRHLWPEMFRIIKELTPRWVIGENVKGLVNLQDGMVFETVCTDLEGEGYEVRAFNIPAAGVGAPHRRERIWIVGHSKHNVSSTTEIKRRDNKINDRAQEGTNKTSEFKRANRSSNNEIMEDSRRALRQGTELRETNEDEVREGYADQHQRSGSASESNVANANESISRERQISRNLNDEGRRTSEARGESLQSEDRQTRTDNIRSSSEDVANAKSELGGRDSGSLWPTNWEFEPNVGRVAHGISGRVHRLKGLGNSIIPQIAEEIGRAIIEAERLNEME